MARSFPRFNWAAAAVALLSVSMVVAPAADLASPLRWRALEPLPDELGVAGPFSGVANGALLVAGGANFPNGSPWEGGQKVWHDTVYLLEKPGSNWTEAGKLPRPLAYGISVTTPGGMVCIGGSDAQRHHRDVFLLHRAGGKLQVKSLPPLPTPMANGCGALLGQTIYVAGGSERPDSTNALRTFWALDLSALDRGWLELEPWPGPARMLSVAAADGIAFYLMSGVGLAGDAAGKPARRYLSDAFRYRPGAGWKRIADLPRPAAAAPSPAPLLGQSHLLILGGDDGTRVNFQPVAQHPGFPNSTLAYHTITDTWKPLGEVPASRVTTSVVGWGDQWVVPSGESRPGVRSREVWAFVVP